MVILHSPTVSYIKSEFKLAYNPAELPLAFTLNFTLNYPTFVVERVNDLQELELSGVPGHKGYVIPEIREITEYYNIGQLTSSVVNSLI